MLVGVVTFGGSPSAQAQLGERVINIAQVSHDTEDGLLTQNTNEAVFIIEAFRSESTIEFFRYAPAAPDAFLTNINGSDFSPDGDLHGGNFTPVGAPVSSNGQVLDFSGDVPLVPASRYLSGELMIVRVIDRGQNGYSDRIETVCITITADNGDQIMLRLYESGPDTGEFYAYVPSTRDQTPQNDNTLTAPADTNLTATYVDSFDSTEVSVDTALVDPFGRVFDSLTGDMINGAVVTIVNAATGQPATVFAVDGFSSYPSTITTGSIVTDAAGLEYPLAPGEFLFPLMAPGDYRLLIEPPAGYIYPSSVEEPALQTLPNAPFEIIPGSYSQTFTVLATGPLNFDVPLDPAGELIVTKEAQSDTASVGDFIGYTVRIENRDVVPAPMRIVDELPAGLRYESGTARLNGAALSNPETSSDGRTLTFSGGVVRAGETAELTYVVGVNAGAQTGEAVNAVIAVNSANAPISNRAEAAVYIREDLLKSRLTIIGRVAESACEEDADWARELEDGIGVEDVRLYMETGEYVVTDEDGLYHFENVKPGTHVVQVDTETLPAGYEAMVCEENSRYAGSAISKFVDATGGTVWRANFYLKRVETVELAEKAARFDDATEYLTYDQAWLSTADSALEWVYPQPERTPSTKSVNIGIKHGPRETVRLYLNDRLVPALNYSGRDVGAANTAGISRWRGVDILGGRNDFRAELLGPDGTQINTLEKTIWFNAEADQATLVMDQSLLVADGRTPPVIAVRLENSAGKPVHAGRVIDIDVEGDYRLNDANDFEGENAVSNQISAREGVSVGADGIARVELEPTLKTGRVHLTVQLDNGRIEDIDAYLKPEKRDWIVVGLAEGTLGLADVKGAAGDFDVDTGSDALNDGRVAFFAKGVIKGEFLLTLAVDTAKRRGARDTQVFNDIDPNAYYTLYGDRTYQDHEAESRYPLYVKLEKDTFYALFGDYNTGLTDTELGRYNRRLSGFKAVHEGERFSVSAFAAETNQGFKRDELAADGTSGPYQLTGRDILRNSETIVVETRDRFRPDRIIATRTLTRYADYEIDFYTGVIIFRHPVNATDASFNPNVILVEYETSADTERNVTAGGRAAARMLDGALEVGATYIREEGDDRVADATSDLIGVDLTAQLGEKTELHAEYARSSKETAGDTKDADAYLIELVRQDDNYTASAYAREDAAGFGLGQQTSTTGGVRRLGATASVRLSESVSEDTGRRAERFIDGQGYSEENLVTDAKRQVGEIALRQESQMLGVSAGLRAVKEELATGEERTSLLATAGIRKTFTEQGLTLSAQHEQPLNNDNETTLFPQRTILGLDKTLTEWATLNVRHERQNGANASGHTTLAGVTVKPWTGGEIRVAADAITQDSGQRLGATVGVDQTFQIDQNWTASVGVTRRDRISGKDTPVDPLADAAVSPVENAPVNPLVLDEAYTALYAGAGYLTDNAAASIRLEGRDGADSKRIAGIVGGAREASERFSYAGAGRAQYETVTNLDGTERDSRTVDARLGTAWRPRGEADLVVYNRFDVQHKEVFGQSKAWKVVNNLGTNAQVTERTQASLFHGIKYSEASFGDVEVDGVTQLAGVEVRHDITKHVDVGLHGSALINHNTDTTSYAWGPSIGVTPVKNVWISAGYNVDGFTDDDFEAAEFSRKGAYVKLRIKFDQHTAENLLKKISPKRD